VKITTAIQRNRQVVHRIEQCSPPSTLPPACAVSFPLDAADRSLMAASSYTIDQPFTLRWRLLSHGAAASVQD